MHPAIAIPADRIADFCRHWKLTEFSLFGSVLRDDFRPDSDVDVLIQSQQGEKPLLRNPYRRDEILRTREVLYAA